MPLPSKTASTTVPEHLVREQLQTMLAHESFAGAEVLSKLLRFIVEETLLGRSDSLKEHVILCEVFGRSIDVSPAEDAVVRGAARRLRTRLHEYYSQPLDHKVVISVEKGGYVATFKLVAESALVSAHEEKSFPSPADAPLVRLRSDSRMLSRDEAKVMLFQHDFYSRGWHATGKGIDHRYRIQPCEGQAMLVVVDDATGLMWQRNGSWDEGFDSLTFPDAKEYVARLNSERRCGFDDWRLPTLEEAMSLMLPKDKLPTGETRATHLDLAFERYVAEFIWTADFASSISRWLVSYQHGFCAESAQENPPAQRIHRAAVKAVRSTMDITQA
jgi:hypothetical protein